MFNDESKREGVKGVAVFHVVFRIEFENKYVKVNSLLGSFFISREGDHVPAV